MNEWISVNDKDRLPSVGCCYLIYDGDAVVEALCQSDSTWYDTLEGWAEYKNVTHWMPKPEPPK